MKIISHPYSYSLSLFCVYDKKHCIFLTFTVQMSVNGTDLQYIPCTCTGGFRYGTKSVDVKCV